MAKQVLRNKDRFVPGPPFCFYERIARTSSAVFRRLTCVEMAGCIAVLFNGGRGLTILKYLFYLTFSCHIVIKGWYYREVKYVEEECKFR